MTVTQMTAVDSFRADASGGENYFELSAEELYEAIAFEEDGVNSESASALVAAVTYEELEVTEAQMTQAMQNIPPAKVNRLSKDEFMRLAESLRSQTPESAGTGNQTVVGTVIPEPRSSKRVAADSGPIATADAKGSHVEAGPAVTTPTTSSSERVADKRDVTPTPAAKRTHAEAARMNRNRLTKTLPTGDDNEEVESGTRKEVATLEWQQGDMRTLLQQSHPVETHNEHAKKRIKRNSSHAQSSSVADTTWEEMANHLPNADKTDSGRRYIREAAEHLAAQGGSKTKRKDVCPYSRNRVSSATLHPARTGGDLEAWLRSLQERAEKPTNQQLQVLRTIVDRITEEATIERCSKKPNSSSSEPLFDLVHGQPGCGKGRLIVWIREAFEEVLGWQHGVQFVCLACHNTVATQMTRENTYHRSSIPASETFNPRDPAKSELIRWILIDDVNTISADLFGQLHLAMQKATPLKSPYLRDDDRKIRPFGGRNVLLLGDMWQVMPVTDQALWTAPWETTSATAYTGAVLLWNRLRRSWVLTESQHCSDTWTGAQDTSLHREDREVPSDQLDAKRRQRPNLRNQATGHVVGPVPVAVGTPRRPTGNVDHACQLFRGRRCRIVGRAPHPKKERLDVDGKWLPTKMPRSIYLFFKNARWTVHTELSTGVYPRTPVRHKWTVDKRRKVFTEKTGYLLLQDFTSTPHMIPGQSLCDTFVDLVTGDETKKPTDDTQVFDYVMMSRAKNPMKLSMIRPFPREMFAWVPQTRPHMHLLISPYADARRSLFTCMSARRETAHDVCLSRQQEGTQSAGVTQLSGHFSSSGRIDKKKDHRTATVRHRRRPQQPQQTAIAAAAKLTNGKPRTVCWRDAAKRALQQLRAHRQKERPTNGHHSTPTTTTAAATDGRNSGGKAEERETSQSKPHRR